MSNHLVEQQIEVIRLDALANAIAWGNAHYSPRLKTARTANGRVYTIPNLQYAAALLEAVSEGRDVGIQRQEAISRGHAILAKILDHLAAGRARRFLAASAPALPDQHVKIQVAGILAFLYTHAKAFSIQPAVHQALSTTLNAILASESRTRRTYQRKRQAGTADKPAIAGFLATLPKGYHWSQQASALDQFSVTIRDLHVCWPFPVFDCALEQCVERCCYISRPDAPQGPYIKTYFYEGDYKARTGPVIPVIFVGGWTPLHASPSAGFTRKNQYSMLPPEYVPSPGNGHHPYPPDILWLDPEFTHKKDFDGLATRLCEAGYNHVRFAQTAPEDDILIAVKDLYVVVDKTKELFHTDKVILVCHSRGGLIARRYILDRWENEQIVDVAKLITYGTPHLGAQLAEIGSQIINEAILPALPGFLAQQFVTLPLLLSVFPDLDLGVINQITAQATHFISHLVKPIWEDLAISLDSMEQLRPNSDFMTDLNTRYSQQVINGKQNFWEAIPHVLIAGTDPSLFSLYLGSWLTELTPLGLAEALAPDGVTLAHHGWWYFPLPYWDFKWTWHTLLDMPKSLVPYVPAMQAVPAFLAGSGDFVVEKTSALADGVMGDIRRTEFAANHFSLICEDKVFASYGPTGMTLALWQVVFYELDLHFSTVSGCDQEAHPCS